MAKRGDDGDDGDNKEPPRTGSVAAEDQAFTKWLNRLWASGDIPSRIRLWQTFGRNKLTRGEMIFHEDFKGTKMDVEEVNRLANDILAAAQNDCDTVRGKSWYQIEVYDKDRTAQPLTRRIGPLRPRREYAIATIHDGENEDGDEDGPLDAKSLMLDGIKEGLGQVRWDKQRYDKVMGEMLILLGGVANDLRQQNQVLFTSQMTMFERWQEAEDRKLDRELVRKDKEFKLGLYKDGMRMLQNTVPRLFDRGEKKNGSNGQSNGSNGQSNGQSNGSNGQTKTPEDFGDSTERTLVGNFLYSCEEDEALHIALFGDFEEKDGKLVQVTPGIFTLKQYAILLGVRDGRMPADALDQLMPESGHENEIKGDQLIKAREAGVTEGMSVALVELVGLRNERNEDKPEPEQPKK
jgi:hypothetical protein